MYVPKKISNDSIKLKYAPQIVLGQLTTTIEWQPAEGKKILLFFVWNLF